MKKIFQGLRMRKRGLLSGLCCLTLVYAAVQFYIQDDYSPLQLLSSVEMEAGRLLKFIKQPHVHCNDSLATGNSSRWLICLDSELGVPSLRSDDQQSLVYSVGPQREYSFEQVISWNMSSAAKLYIFCHEKCRRDNMHTNPSRTTFYSAVIVSNDPADFARNSFESQTLNNVMKTLHHDSIHVLKLDSFIESVQSFEVLRYLIEDSLLKSVQELHFVVNLDKLEEDFIYSWYRVLYALFTTAGFRLFHTSASDQLCLQDTVMESCSYHLSWVKQPPPHVFVMHPPAIDGSKENEEDRLLSYLQTSKSQEASLTEISMPVGRINSQAETHKDTLSLDLSSAVLERHAQSCHIVLIRNSACRVVEKLSIRGCSLRCFESSILKDGTISLQEGSQWPNSASKKQDVEHLKEVLMFSHTNIVYVELQEYWSLLYALSNMALPQHVDQLIMRAGVFPAGGRSAHTTLRTRYSELQRLQQFGFSLVKVDKTSNEDLKFSMPADVYTLNFVKSFLL